MVVVVAVAQIEDWPRIVRPSRSRWGRAKKQQKPEAESSSGPAQQSNSKAEEAGDAKVADDGDVKERQQWSALKLCRRSGTRDWFACVTYEKATAPTPLVQDIISVDPGVRRGLVAYSAATGAITYMGETVTPQQPGGDPLALGASLARLRPIANGAQQQLSLSQGRDFIARRRLQRTHRQVRQAVDNFHWHAARDLSRAAVVLLPKFSASQMLRKRDPSSGSWTRVVGPAMASNMQTVAHYRLRQRIRDRCFETGSRLLIVDEKYTSKYAPACLLDRLAAFAVLRPSFPRSLVLWPRRAARYARGFAGRARPVER